MSVFKNKFKFIADNLPTWHVFFIVAIFIIGMVAGKFVLTNSSASFFNEVRGGASGNKFTNPLLECDSTDVEYLGHYIPFEKIAQDRINKEIVSPNPDISVSVYFRNLNNGPWFGMNIKSEFFPASLLKVPILITYYRLAENNPNLLTKKIVYSFHTDSHGVDLTQHIVPQHPIELGQTYTVDELITHMITDSDNEAMFLLLNNIDNKEVSKTFTDLGLRPGDDPFSPTITVKEYASFFRILYNASYLDRIYSEKALKLLSEINYKDGLNAGVPTSVVISHKFGERYQDTNTGRMIQIHDCGIVYKPGYPYLLCVMTAGTDFDQNEQIIAQVSKIVYDSVSGK